MPRGYIEGPAADEAERRAEAAALGEIASVPRELRSAVFGSTSDDAEPHFLGWLGEVDPDALFASGEAWGVTVRRLADSPPG